MAVLTSSIPVVLAFMIFSGAALWAPCAAAGSKLAELERKIADLSLLHRQLEERLQQVKRLRALLTDQQHSLTSEIRIHLPDLKNKSLQQSQQNLRVRYNIELLATLMSYLKELDEKILFYQTGCSHLLYLQQLAEDDRRMVAALNNLKIDALTTQISLVINRYLPEAHFVQFDRQRLSPFSPQQVWGLIASGL